MSSTAVGALMRAPLDTCSTAADAPLRTEVKFPRIRPENYQESGFFRQTGGRDFRRQYWHVYRRRLEVLAPRVRDACGQSSSDRPILALSELDKVEKGREVILVGTVFKNQALKPDILKELAEDNGLPPPPKRDKYVSDDDDAVFEDDLQRIKLRGSNFDVGSIVTGVVCAFLGSERESGKFFVEKVFFPRPPMQVERPLPQQDRFIAFISGLELASKSSDALGPFQLALDWLLGEAGDVDEVKWVANIERVVVAGNSLAEATKDRSHLSQAKYLTKDRVAGSVEAVALLDDLLVQLAAGLEVDIMPGEFDPANQVLPQQPLHPCLFPRATAYPTFRTVTNPYSFDTDGTRILGTDGQNTDDVLRNSLLESPIEAMKCLIRWSHLAPTAPDTLRCFPFKDRDPFILDEGCPHVLFAGNQRKFEQGFYEDKGVKITLLSVPRFSVTRSLVLLNLRTLEAEEVTFSVDLDE